MKEIERVGKHEYVMVESYRNEQELFNLAVLGAHRGVDSSTPTTGSGSTGISATTGDYEFIYLRMTATAQTTKAAILAQSRAPLIVDEILLPDALEAGQVLVEVLHTTICGAQLNEIEAAKGPDKFLPHLLGHEASAIVRETGPGVTHVQPGDSVVLHWRPSQGIQSRTPRYQWRGAPLNAGWVTTFNDMRSSPKIA